MICAFKNLATGALFFSLIGLTSAFAASTKEKTKTTTAATRSVSVTETKAASTTGKTSKKDGCTCTATMTAPDPTQKKEDSQSSVTKAVCQATCKDIKWQAQSAWQSMPGASWTYTCTWGDEKLDSGKKTSVKAIKK